MQCTLSGCPFPDEALSVVRETHRVRSDGAFPPRIDLGRYFRQRRLVTA
jgi:hypothetical protein